MAADHDQPNGNNYAGRIIQALEDAEPRESIAQVKNVLIRELSVFDRSMRVRSTGFFNHTTAPDFVLSWPKSNNPDRFMYLRFTDDLEYLAYGLNAVADSRPLVVGLTPIADEQEGRALVQKEAAASRCLVTDPAGIERLIHGERQAPVLSLLSNAIAQGGRGLLATPESEEAARTVAAGFESARTVNSEPTARATQLVDRLLDRPYAARMNHFLEAMWVASGGTRASFPGPVYETTELGDDALQFLLDFAEIDDLEFWRSVGRRLTVEQLSHVDVRDPCPNLQHIVRANLDVLWARGCAIVSREPLRGGSMIPRWTAERGKLALRGETFSAYVAQSAEALRDVRIPYPTDGIELQILRDRSEDVVLYSLRMSDGDESVVISSERDEDVVRSDRAAALARASSGVKVQEALALLASGQRATVDFCAETVVGRTTSKLSLRELVPLTVKLLVQMPAEALEAIGRLLPPLEAFEQRRLPLLRSAGTYTRRTSLPEPNPSADARPDED